MEKPNIALIITDCLRYDVAPGLKTWKEADSVVESAYTVAPSTFLALPSILTGTFPFAVMNGYRLKRSVVTYLPLVLSLFGYDTVYITANAVTSRPYGYYVVTENSFLEDFVKKANKRSFGSVLLNNLKRYVPGFLRKFLVKLAPFVKRGDIFSSKIRAEHINASLFALKENLLNSVNRPKFFYLHYIDTHSPYGVPSLKESERKYASYLARKQQHIPHELIPEEVQHLKGFYLQEAEYMDRHIMQVLDFWDDIYGLENFVVFIFSDHGEGFGENGVYMHPDEMGLVEPILHVPLALYYGKNYLRYRNAGTAEGKLFSTYRFWNVAYVLASGGSTARESRGVSGAVVDLANFFEDKVHAVSYRKDLKENYYPKAIAQITKEGGISVYDLRDKRGESLFKDIIARESRSYLKKKIALSRLLR